MPSIMDKKKDTSFHETSFVAVNEDKQVVSRRQFLGQVGVGVGCASLLPAASAFAGAMSDSAQFLHAQLRTQQSVPWLQGNSPMLLSLNQQGQLVLQQTPTQSVDKPVTGELRLSVDENISALIQGAAQPSSPRIYFAQDRYWLTFASGSSESSMQTYIAVADTLNQPFQLQRSKPVCAGRELSMFTDKHGDAHLLAVDGTMVSVAAFNTSTQQVRHWRALVLAQHQINDLQSPVMSVTTSGYQLAVLQSSGKALHQFNAVDLNSTWSLTSSVELDEQAQGARIAFDHKQQLWYANNGQLDANGNATTFASISSVARA